MSKLTKILCICLPLLGSNVPYDSRAQNVLDLNNPANPSSPLNPILLVDRDHKNNKTKNIDWKLYALMGLSGFWYAYREVKKDRTSRGY